jgi:hypothetical protein
MNQIIGNRRKEEKKTTKNLGICKHENKDM